MVSVILLSAGLSSRFGSPKALAKIGENFVINTILSKVIETNILEVLVVLGAQKDAIKPVLLKHKKVKVVYNKNYNFGQTSSFKAGLIAVDDKSLGAMLLPVDYPFIKKNTFNFLINNFINSNQNIVIPSYMNIKAHPPIFPLSLFKDFQDLNNHEGINLVAQRYPQQTTILDVNDPGVISTFNTRDEFEAIKQDFGINA